ncbi:hypothetical protein PEPIB1_4 (plasmid) [Tritonibacter mobilis]|nr:hypothetical protein PEPIB1_4 [Tritonibacter mobilis]
MTFHVTFAKRSAMRSFMSWSRRGAFIPKIPIKAPYPSRVRYVQ